jgi:superfamily II DNA or RNA helicase
MNKDLQSIPVTEERLIIATGSYLGEGFDDPRLDTLFLVFPISWRGRLAQYAGRLHRLHENKKQVIIYDYADLHVPVLARMFRRRQTGYKRMGYHFQDHNRL